jgi:hypothetical protein
MHISLAPENHLVGIAVLLPKEGWVFFQQLGECGAELHFVTALGRGNGQGVDRVNDLGLWAVQTEGIAMGSEVSPV